MKKILCTLAVVGLASSMFAQGTVSFANSSATWIQFKPQGGSAAAVTGNGGFVEILWAPTGTAIAKAWDPAAPSTLAAWLTANPGWKALDTSIKAINPAGRFNTGLQTIPTATPGAKIDAAIATWVGNYASFDAAYAAGAANPTTVGVGISTPFTVQTGDPTITPAGIPGGLPLTGVGAFGGLTATPVAVPEPSTLALLGLGAAALTILRRRK